MVTTTEQEILHRVNEAIDGKLVLSVKGNNNLDKIESIGVVSNDKYFITDTILDQQNFINSLLNAIELQNLKLYVYDLKEFFKLALNILDDHVNFNVINNFIDLKLYLYDRFGTKVSLFDESIMKLTGREISFGHLEHYKSLYSFDSFPYQVLVPNGIIC